MQFIECLEFKIRSNNIKQKVNKLSIPKLLPNIFTTIGLCTGLTGIRFALESDWERAVICILIAAFFDLIDGLSARLLKAFSRFGAELDSLADAISFGVAPTIISFLWFKSSSSIIDNSNTEVLGWYWIPFLLYTMCCAFRLARFNVMANEQTSDQPQMKKRFFVGVPAPAAAVLVLLPMVFEFAMSRLQLDKSIIENPEFLLFWVCVVGCLMISTIPTFSLRNLQIRISVSKALPVLIMVCLIFAVFVKEMWITLLFFGLLYLLSIPLFYFFYHKFNSQKD